MIIQHLWEFEMLKKYVLTIGPSVPRGTSSWTTKCDQVGKKQGHAVVTLVPMKKGRKCKACIY